MDFLRKVSVFTLLSIALIACDSDDIITDCEEFQVTKIEHTCKNFSFESTAVNHNPHWYVYTHPDPDPEYLGNNHAGLDFDPTEPGNYTVVAVYENASCPEGVTIGFDVDVTEDCFVDIDCEEFSVVRENHSCNSFTFTSNAISINPRWYVYTHPDPEPEYLGNNHAGLDFDPTEPGNYTVVAVYENENCPEGVTIGFDVDVTEDCFVDIDCEEFSVVRENHSCNSFTFTSNAISINPRWYVYTHPDPEPEYLGNNHAGLDFDPTEPGNYTVVAVYENASCPEGVTIGFDVDVTEDCFVDIDCEEFSVVRENHSCNSFTFTSNAISINPRWYVYTHPDPEPEYLGNNHAGLDFDPTEPGNYTVVAVYENENCPEGVTIGFDVDVTEDCF